VPDLGISVGESVNTSDGLAGSPPPPKPERKLPPPPPDDEPQARFTARLFESVQLFARGPNGAFSTCFLPA
jgi:hypothetical protein